MNLPSRNFAIHCSLVLALAGSVARVASESRGAVLEGKELLVLGASVQSAEFAGVDDEGQFLFKTDGGEEFSVPRQDLVRWSNPEPVRSADEVLLIDGSRVSLAGASGNSPGLTLNLKFAVLGTRDFGQVQVTHDQLRAALWRLPPDDEARQAAVDGLQKARGAAGDDLLVLENGDQIAGRIAAISLPEGSAGASTESVIALKSSVGDLTLPISRVRGICFSGQGEPTATNRPRDTLIVGLRSGTLVASQGINRDGEQVSIRTFSMGKLKAKAADVAFLQSLGGRFAYLSDLEPLSYQEEPYLDLHWPFHRDRSVLGQPLRVQGRAYLKGLGMHSAARLTFTLPGDYHRFAAAAAIDDAAAGRGSVIFRVYQHKIGQWREAYASPVVRGGDPPLALAVDLDQADQLALAVEYADRGDECDYADWLDARVEGTTGADPP